MLQQHKVRNSWLDSECRYGWVPPKNDVLNGTDIQRSTAQEYGKYGITVNAYAPGAIETQFRE